MEAINQQSSRAVHWVLAVFYAITVGASAGVLSYIAIIVSGPFYSSGEAWQGLALTWYFRGMPGLLIGVVLSIFVFPMYYRGKTIARKLAIYLANVICLAAIVLGITLLAV